MKQISIDSVGYVFRWSGGSFVAVWKEDRAKEHVPDDMIDLPKGFNRSKATRDDIARIADAWTQEHRHSETEGREQLPGPGKSVWEITYRWDFDPEDCDPYTVGVPTERQARQVVTAQLQVGSKILSVERVTRVQLDPNTFQPI